MTCQHLPLIQAAWLFNQGADFWSSLFVAPNRFSRWDETSWYNRHTVHRAR